MKTNTLFGWAALVLASGYFLRSLPMAIAYPQGPNISAGSNPVHNFYGDNNNVVLALDPTSNFIITTAFSNNQSCSLRIDGNPVNYSGSNAAYYNPLLLHTDYRKTTSFIMGSAKLKVEAGQSVQLVNCSTYYVEGYYTH